MNISTITITLPPITRNKKSEAQLQWKKSLNASQFKVFSTFVFKLLFINSQQFMSNGTVCTYTQSARRLFKKDEDIHSNLSPSQTARTHEMHI